jgi:hypothetical protein
MAKGQKRSSREPKKPKAEKPKPATGATSILKGKPGTRCQRKPFGPRQGPAYQPVQVRSHGRTHPCRRYALISLRVC